VTTRVVDCRHRADYEAGHLPGAVHLDPETVLSDPPVDPAVGGRHPLPEMERLTAAFGQAGIDEGTFVLAYDDGSGWAARCWWLLRHLGHDLCGTLDLRDYTGPLVTDEPIVAHAPFTARARDDDTIDADEIRARLGDPALVLVDTRAPERWRGDSEPLDPVAGRIPGALNAYFEDPLPDALGLLDAGELAVYCGSGVSAAPIVQQLVLAGREDARLYPGSFSEWCRNPSNPIERGEP
jgi:thiosulfate/3-mercaptopyruvate sulfurtransferase